MFVAAIEVNKAAIYKIATVYTNGAEDRDDLVQEILYQLWKSFDTFQQKSSIGTWIYRVAMNVANYQLKAASKRVATVELIDATAQHGDAPQGGEEERWRMLKAQIHELNLLEKAIVVLYLEDKSYDEIAEIVGISVSNVGTKLSRIKEKLRTNISKQL